MLSSDTPTIDKQTARLVRVSAVMTLSAGMIFFTYSAYAGAFLGGGSTQIFTGVACLALSLVSCILIEKITLENTTSNTTPSDVE